MVDVPFLAFVLALGLIVAAVSYAVWGARWSSWSPRLLAVVAPRAGGLAAVLANAINNLPRSCYCSPPSLPAAPVRCWQC